MPIRLQKIRALRQKPQQMPSLLRRVLKLMHLTLRLALRQTLPLSPKSTTRAMLFLVTGSLLAFLVQQRQLVLHYPVP
jgi:hypothetical protein